MFCNSQEGIKNLSLAAQFRFLYYNIVFKKTSTPQSKWSEHVGISNLQAPLFWTEPFTIKSLKCPQEQKNCIIIADPHTSIPC